MRLWHAKDLNLLIYDHVHPFAVEPLQENAVVKNQHLYVKRSLRTCQILRHFNYPVPPIIENYDWPAPPGMRPWESQVQAANFMALHPHCFNLSDPGCGKTNSALWSADWLMRQNPGMKTLIISPLSTLERVWGKAIFSNFLGRREFKILHGTEDKRLKALSENADFYVINPDGPKVGASWKTRQLVLNGFSKMLFERKDIGIIIIDEASGYRDSTSRRHRIGRIILGNRPYLWLMTGTPVPNAPTDAYGLAKLVNNANGKSFSGFRDETMLKRGPFKWVPKPDGYDKARALLTPSIRFAIEDVWDGPVLTTQQRDVDLTKEQLKLLADLKRDLIIRVNSGKQITAETESSVRWKALQISLGAIYDEKHKWHLVDASPRISVLKEVISESSGKVLVFVPLTSVIELLNNELKGWSRAIVNGNVSAKERDRIFSNFQEKSDPHILLADPTAMAHGLDLYAARMVVWYGSTDRNELYLQGNKRAHRPGQKYPVTVVQLASTPLEREIYRRLDTQTTMQGALLDLIKRGEW